MCLSNRQLDANTKHLMSIGNLCLVAGLLLWNFVHPSSQIQKDWLHGIYGFLMGLSITINLCALRFARRRGAASPLSL
jgi:hypothetical protein